MFKIRLINDPYDMSNGIYTDQKWGAASLRDLALILRMTPPLQGKWSPLSILNLNIHTENLCQTTPLFWNAPSPLYTLNLFSHLFWMTLQKGTCFLTFVSLKLTCLGSRSLSKAFPLFYLWSPISNSYPSSFLLEIPSHFISVTWQLNGLILINQTKGYSL